MAKSDLEPTIRLNDVDFPVSLFEAQANNKLIIFCGAGISDQKNEDLTHFRSFEDLYAKTAGHFDCLPVNQPLELVSPLPDHFDALKDSFSREAVTNKVCSLLDDERAQPTEYHRHILQLSKKVITTNFDSLFDKALEDLTELGHRQKYYSPTLPTHEFDEAFEGIIYLHGHIKTAKSLIFSGCDFGKAYTYPGYISRFLGPILSSHQILFIGYSCSDPDFQLLLKAIKTYNNANLWIITEDDSNKLKELGLKVIKCPPGIQDRYENRIKLLAKWLEFRKETDNIDPKLYLSTFSGTNDEFAPIIKLKILDKSIRKDEFFKNGNVSAYKWMFEDPELFKHLAFDAFGSLKMYQDHDNVDHKKLVQAFQERFLAEIKIREGIKARYIPSEALDIRDFDAPDELISKWFLESKHIDDWTDKHIVFSNAIEKCFTWTIELLETKKEQDTPNRWLAEIFRDLSKQRECLIPLIRFLKANEAQLAFYIYEDIEPKAYYTARNASGDLFNAISTEYINETDIAKQLHDNPELDSWFLNYALKTWQGANTLSKRNASSDSDWYTTGINHIGGKVTEFWMHRFAYEWNHSEEEERNLALFEKHVGQYIEPMFNSKTHTAYASLATLTVFLSWFFIGENPIETNPLLQRIIKLFSHTRNKNKEQWRALWHGLFYIRNTYYDLYLDKAFEQSLFDSLPHIKKLASKGGLSENDVFGQFMQLLLLQAQTHLDNVRIQNVTELLWWKRLCSGDEKTILGWWVELTKAWKSLNNKDEQRFISAILKPSFENLIPKSDNKWVNTKINDWVLSILFKLREDQESGYIQLLTTATADIHFIELPENYNNSYLKAQLMLFRLGVRKLEDKQPIIEFKNLLVGKVGPQCGYDLEELSK